MTHYAYLRVSTDRQDVDNQKHGILDYCNSHGLTHLHDIRDAASGRTKWRQRKIGELLTETAQGGDTVVFAEISRMARSTLQVLEMLGLAAELVRYLVTLIFASLGSAHETEKIVC